MNGFRCDKNACRCDHSWHFADQNDGQAIVEFTLVFVLLLVLAWIPADYGLAFFTGQIAQNASREGARLAAANRTNPAGTTSCVLPCTAATGILRATADRMSSALLPGGVVTLTVDGGA